MLGMQLALKIQDEIEKLFTYSKELPSSLTNTNLSNRHSKMHPVGFYLTRERVRILFVTFKILQRIINLCVSILQIEYS